MKHAFKNGLQFLFSGLFTVFLIGSTSAQVIKTQAHSGASGVNIAGNPVNNPANMQARSSRHALIVGVGDYINPTIPQLKGIKYDIESALKMVNAMHIPIENTRILRDHEATAARIESEIADLNTRTQPGDRVFFYFSGHGSRWYDASAKNNGCVEALLAADSRLISNERIASIMKPISDKTDKLFVFYDACHSGGIVDKPMSLSRSMGNNGGLVAKFSPSGVADACAKPANIKTRSLVAANESIGGLPQNIVQISSSRPDEVSFDDENAGGLATQAWRDCMLGEAQDQDGSGGISVDEISACAQKRIDARFAGNAQFAAQHFTIGGNRAFVTNWFSSAFSAPNVVTKPTDPSAALTEIYAQRDSRRSVSVKTMGNSLKIGKDSLDLSVTSSHAGYLYLILLGSDNSSFYLLFPNEKDGMNMIAAGQTLRLPRPDWQITAQGPAGIDRMLVVVSESPRDLASLGAEKIGPFLQTLTNQDGRANLQWLIGSSMYQASKDCGAVGRNVMSAKKCSDAFGAAMVDIVEKN